MNTSGQRGLFFFHNPKAAGTAVNRALAAMFAPADRCPLIENTQRDHEQRAGGYSVFAGYRYYAGHYGRDIFDQVADNHDPVTNFRHPAARLASLYDYYRLKVVVPDDETSRDALYPVIMAQTHDFHDFVTMEDPRVEIHTRNHHTRQLCASAWDPGSHGDAAVAAALLDRMKWFYVCEQPEASQRWAGQAFGGQCGRIGWEHITAGSAGVQRALSDIGPRTRRVIDNKNALDLALYEHALARLRTMGMAKAVYSFLIRPTKGLLNFRRYSSSHTPR